MSPSKEVENINLSKSPNKKPKLFPTPSNHHHHENESNPLTEMKNQINPNGESNVNKKNNTKEIKIEQDPAGKSSNSIIGGDTEEEKSKALVLVGISTHLVKNKSESENSSDAFSDDELSAIKAFKKRCCNTAKYKYVKSISSSPYDELDDVGETQLGASLDELSSSEENMSAILEEIQELEQSKNCFINEKNHHNHQKESNKNENLIENKEEGQDDDDNNDINVDDLEPLKRYDVGNLTRRMDAHWQQVFSESHGKKKQWLWFFLLRLWRINNSFT